MDGQLTMGVFQADEGKAKRILSLVKAGVDTVADIEADMDFVLTRHRIAAHISNLKKEGKIRSVGTLKIPTEGTGRYRNGSGYVTAHRYAATDQA